MSSGVSVATERIILRCWAVRAGLTGWPEASDGVVLATGDGTVVHVLELLDALLLILPRNAEARVRDVPREAFSGLDATLDLLSDLQPRKVVEASLSYRDARDGERSNEAPDEADEKTIARLRSKCPEADWNEGGIDELDRQWVSVSAQGAVAAAAGYERWPAGVAHLGVVTDPNFRRGGHASEAAATATQAALAAGLTAQWRSRIGNEPSRRLARRLGFTPVGRQSVIVLEG